MPTRTTHFDRFNVHQTELRIILDMLGDADQPNDDDGPLTGITVERAQVQASAPHATAQDVVNQLAIGGSINDSAALAIASWYESPRGSGATFAALASGCTVAVDELLDAIATELGGSQGTTDRYVQELEALARWAEGMDEPEPDICDWCGAEIGIIHYGDGDHWQTTPALGDDLCEVRAELANEDGIYRHEPRGVNTDTES